MTAKELEALGYKFEDRMIYLNYTTGEICPFSYYKDAGNDFSTFPSYHSVDGVEYKEDNRLDDTWSIHKRGLEKHLEWFQRKIDETAEELESYKNFFEKLKQFKEL